MRRTVFLLCLAAICCREEPPPPSYRAVAVERRNIVVSAEAAGTVEPDVAVEVKSKASGEILEIGVDTGDRVTRGTLIVRIDQRQPRNTLAQAEAELEVARARLANAQAQMRRSENLFKAESVSETAFEQAVLDTATAKAEVVRARVAVENARIQLEDTDVLAPITGVVIEKNVERGQVISSPTQDVGGGTLLLKLADLGRVRVRSLVDEVDIGKIGPGDPATVTVTAYPNQPFQGEVLKLEPQSVTHQNVTMFPVLVSIDNREGLLRPGMNCEVEIHLGRRQGVLAIPNAALRTPQDALSAARVLDLSEAEVHRALGLPEGAGEPEALPDERAASHAAAGNGAPTGRFEFGGHYIVFAMRGESPVPVTIRTGLTDLDYTEVVEGLSESDSVLVLPSASLVRSQERFHNRIRSITGDGLPGVRSEKR
jgi:HlyD family secretion protein